ncbi:P-loop NTPase fold protein [Pedobacter sp. AJM]|uniref:KAP family P-loop NTPase fold protein n=1 Tax=Pedobacter sp. AJM TaxID=2003629 RepID=UPI000B4A6BFF|nr:P-loop NTPase fold protein [Pedobacter sp. AJM]OWK70324.1 NTPase [Pedobacter sp. AJM]
MWSDNETSEDLLGFKVHADLLIDVIKDDSVLPVTIGVFGDWGSGKSSILKIISESLSGKDEDDLLDETLVLYFNGWIFEGYDDAKAALLQTIIERFEKHKTLGNKIKDKARGLLRSVDWMRVASLGFKNVIVPGAAALLSGGTSLIPHLVSKLAGINGTELAAKLSGDGAEDFIKGIIKESPEEESKLVREFRDEFEDMIDKSGIKKLVVIIDDLDRCSPERIIENLEAIKLFLNVKNTAFVIGADPRIVRHAIEHRYKTNAIENAGDKATQNKRIVNDYLEKLIQIPYNLPRLSDSEVETYMTLLFCKLYLDVSFENVHTSFAKHREQNRYSVFGFADIEAMVTDEEKEKLQGNLSLIASLAPIITEGLNGNPRQIKRFLNTYTLRNRLVKIAKLGDFKQDVLAKLMVLEYAAPPLFRQLYEWQAGKNGEPSEIVDLEELADEKDLETIKTRFKDWSEESIIRWLAVSPRLTGVDLRDYYWISRDKLESSLSGASLVPVHLRNLVKSLLEYPAGSVVEKLVKDEVKDRLNGAETEIVLQLLEKALIKHPENSKIHKVFIEMMAVSVPQADQVYKAILPRIDQNVIPFSLRSEFQIAERKNPEIKNVIKAFKKGTSIYNALNQK